jgi:ClpP class serine protease
MILQAFYNSIWAIEPEYLKFIEQIVTEHKRYSPEDFAALEAKLGKKLENNPDLYARNDGKTVIIPVTGPIVRYGNLFTDVSGMTSLGKLSLMFNSALENDEVRDIVFDISSPGGEALGINEFAQMVYNARGIKPIKAYASGNAQSAAYWIASACEEVICDDTAGLGSIGVAVFIDDDTEALASSGIKELIIKNSLSPNKAPSFRTSEGQKHIIERLDKMADVFFSKVALYMSREGNELTAKDVVKRFKEGGTAIGQEAVDLGMADRLGSLEGLLKELEENDMKEAIQADNAKESANEGIIATATLQPTVSMAEFEKLSKMVEDLAKSKKETEEALEAKEKIVEDLNKKIASSEDFIENAKKEALRMKAESTFSSFGDKVTTAQKDDFVKLFEMAAGAGDEYVATLTSFVESNVGVELLDEELLASGDLRELPNEETKEDEWKDVDEFVTGFATNVNNRKNK